MDLWSRLADVHSRWNVLDHPFYERWSRGELTAAELALYAGQYRHAVVALAAAADGAAQQGDSAGLAAHAGEEAAHVALWDAFADAAGTDGPQPAERLDGADADALVAEAERVLRANWMLLDGVERLCAA